MSNTPVSSRRRLITGGIGAQPSSGDADAKNGSTLTTTPPLAVRTLHRMGFGPARRKKKPAPAAVANQLFGDDFEVLDFGGYVPGGGVTYPNTGVANNLKLIATLIRANIGLNVATVDVGGWDTHNSQGVFEYGGFHNLVRDLSAALTAFYRDMKGAGFHQRVAVVVQTEFGRQVTENASAGTDHGLAYPMFILGGKVKGGWHGQFPSLAQANTPGDAVKPMVDFRQVLATVSDKLVGNTDPEGVFHSADSPFSYSPMGFWNP